MDPNLPSTPLRADAHGATWSATKLGKQVLMALQGRVWSGRAFRPLARTSLGSRTNGDSRGFRGECVGVGILEGSDENP